MSSAASGPKSRAEIANVLTIQLAVIAVVSGAVMVPLSLLTVEFSLGWFVVAPFVGVLNLWLVVRAVFAALDELLETKLAAMNDASS